MLRVTVCVFVLLLGSGCQHSRFPRPFPANATPGRIAAAVASLSDLPLGRSRRPIIIAKTKVEAPPGTSWHCFWKDGRLASYLLERDFDGPPFSYPAEVVRHRGRAIDGPSRPMANIEAVTAVWEISTKWQSRPRDRDFAEAHRWLTYHVAVLCEEDHRVALVFDHAPAPLVGSGHIIVLECDDQQCRAVQHMRIWIA